MTGRTKKLSKDVRAVIEKRLPHSEGCDLAWTQGVCARCDILANLSVVFGFADPVGKSNVDAEELVQDIETEGEHGQMPDHWREPLLTALEELNTHEQNFMREERGGLFSSAIGLARLALANDEPEKARQRLDEAVQESYDIHRAACIADGWDEESLDRFFGVRPTVQVALNS